MKPFGTTRIILLATSILAFPAGAAHAQEAGAAPSAPSEGGSSAAGDQGVQAGGEQAAPTGQTGLQDIVVTAQRRAERLQDVPVSIAAIGREDLARANVTSVTDVQRLVPGLVITAGTGAMTTFLRGVGNPSNIAGNEASVPVYIDGIYYSRLSPALLKVSGVERIEVLKGPQGTLFGRNSTGGLVNVITRDPSFTPQIEANAGYANYDTVSASTYMSSGLGENVAANLSVNYLNQGDGWGKNVITGDDVRKQRYFIARGKILVNFDDRTSVKLTADYMHSNADQSTIAGQPANGTTQGNPIGLPPTIYTAEPNFYDVHITRPLGEITTVYGFTGRIEHDLDFAQLVSTTAYHKGNLKLYVDGDYTPADWSTSVQFNPYQMTSQELQLISNPGGKLDWVLGLYYLHSEDGYKANFNYGPQFGANATVFRATQKINSYAAYAQATYHVTPTTGITAGLRYTDDNVSGSGRTDTAQLTTNVLFPEYRDFVTTVTGPTTYGKTGANKVNWRLAIDQKLDEDIMVYASASTGYKSGIFNLLGFNGVALKPETVKAYEIGLKSSLFDRRLRFNAAGFWYDESNVQIQQTINNGGIPVVVLANAAKARVKGIDMDAEWLVTRGLTLALGGTYLDAKFRDFPGAPININNTQLETRPDANGNPALFVPGCTVPASGNLDPANGGNVGNCPTDASGTPVPRAPKWIVTGGFNYQVDLGRGTLDLSGDFAYNDGFRWSAGNPLRQDSYTLVGGSVLYTFPGDNYSIKFWGKNLTGSHYNAYVSTTAGPPGNVSVPGEPRTYGITLGAKF